MGKKMSSVTLQCGWIPEGPVAYELWSGTADLVFDASGNPPFDTVSVAPFRLNGTSRSALAVNTAASDFELWFKAWSQSGTEIATLKTTSLPSSNFRNYRTARFDLVPKAAALNGGYAESSILSSRQVNITHDGTNGTNGSFTSTVFVRSPQKPTTPTGGKYTSPYPTSKVTVGSEQRSWTDAPLSGPDPVWISRAIFNSTHTSDANAPTWSDPSPAVDSNDVEFIWSTEEDPALDVNVHPYSAATFSGWTKDATDAVWMATAIKSNSVWQAWQKVRIKGEKGDKGDKGDNAVVFTLDPNQVTFKKGTASESYVYLDINDGGEMKNPSSIELFAGNKTWELAAPGLRLDIVPGNGGGRSAIKLTYFQATDIDLTKTIRVNYGGKPYSAELHVLTVADGQNGDTGPRGMTGPFSPPPHMWEDYDNGYEFQNGVTDVDGNPATRKDSVYYKFAGDKAIAYECIKSHVKGDFYVEGVKVDDTPDENCKLDPESQARVWKLGSTYSLVSTEVLLAANAFIKFMSANGIRLYNDAGQIVGQMSAINGAPSASSILLPLFIGGVMGENGAFTQNPLFAVGTNGKTYHGGVTGQRIEIDPEGKRILVYGSSGALCAIYSGEELDWQTVWQSASSSGTTTKQPSEMYRHLTGADTAYSADLATGTATADGTLEIATPAFTVVANGTDYGNPGVITSPCTSELYLEVVSGSRVIASFKLGATVGLNETYSLPANPHIRVSLKSGTAYKVRLRYVSILNAGGTVTFTAGGTFSSKFTVINKVCHYGANGWYIATSNQNYSYCIYDSSGVMHQRVVRNGVKHFCTDTDGAHFSVN